MSVQARVGSEAVFPLLERTATSTVVKKNLLGQGAIIYINCTAVTDSGASVTFAIAGVVPDGGTATRAILTSAAITGTGLTTLQVHPNLTASANVIAKDFLPSDYQITATHADAKRITYSVTVEYLP